MRQKYLGQTIEWSRGLKDLDSAIWMPEVQRTCLRLEKRLDISKLIENMTMNWESSSFKSMRTMGWWRNSMPISQFDSKCPLTIHWVFQLLSEQNKNWWFRIRSSIFSFYVRQEIHNSNIFHSNSDSKGDKSVFFVEFGYLLNEFQRISPLLVILEFISELDRLL